MLNKQMSNLLGHQRVFLTNMILFALASLTNGLTPSTNVLVTARTIQSINTTLLSPATLALMTVTFPIKRERNLALSI